MYSSNGLPLEFQRSFIERSNYPSNSIHGGINTYPSALAGFAKRLDAAAVDLCQSKVENVDVYFRDLKTDDGSGKGSYLPRCKARDPIVLIWS